jgi:hypothetical protein
MNNFISDPKELVSESLQDVLPSEEVTDAYNEMFISVLLMTENHNDSLVGTLIGIEFSEKNPKIDIRISLDDAFSLISKNFSEPSQIAFSEIALAYNEKVTKVVGPFDIVNAKIIDFDSNAKLCVLAIDLINTSKELP